MILCGDWAPGKMSVGAGKLIPNGDLRDCVLLNLEGPILPADHALAPSPKAGPSLFSTAAPPGDGRLVCSLANNHAMDYGELGLALTREVLRARGALPVGASATRAAAREPVFVNDRGANVAIIACCEAQFGAAELERSGVAAMGPWVPDAIRACRLKADAVVVSVHAGAELAPWPAPVLQDLYRSWIDAGASVIHGHHPHTPQGFEEYGGGLILYGLGNLAVNPQDWDEYSNALWSLAAEVDLSAAPLRWGVRTLAVRGDGEGMEIVPDEEEDHAAYLADCNRALADRELLEALWQEVAIRAYGAYYRTWLRFPQEKRGLRKRMPLACAASAEHASGAGGASRQDMRLWYHLFACQTHADSIATALGVLCGELPDLRTAETRTLVEQWMPRTIQQKATAEALA